MLSFEKILFMIKTRCPKTTHQISGSELQNTELHKELYLDREKFENTVFFDKHHLGYYKDCTYTIKKRSEFDYLDSYCYIADKFKNEAFLGM